MPSSLPVELIGMIFAHLDKDTLFMCCLVSKSFIDIATPRLYKTVKLPGRADILGEMLQVPKERIPNILAAATSVVIEPYTDWYEDGFGLDVGDAVLHFLPRCVALRIDQAHWVGSVRDVVYPSSWARLKVLVLSELDIKTNMANFARIAAHCSALRKLVLNNVRWDDGLLLSDEPGTTALTSLETLHVHPIRYKDLPRVLSILDLAQHSLKELHFTIIPNRRTEVRMLQSMLKHMERCTFLRHLSYGVIAEGDNFDTVVHNVAAFRDVAAIIPQHCEILTLFADFRNFTEGAREAAILHQIHWPSILASITACPSFRTIRIVIHRSVEALESVRRRCKVNGKILRVLSVLEGQGMSVDVTILDRSFDTIMHAPYGVGFWYPDGDDIFVLE